MYGIRTGEAALSASARIVHCGKTGSAQADVSLIGEVRVAAGGPRGIVVR
jgi:hypothetical protein